MKSKIFLLCFALLSLYSCDGDKVEKLQNQVDSLAQANNELTMQNQKMQKELDGYRYSPEKLCANIAELREKEDLNTLKTIKQQLEQFHPSAKELTEVTSIINSIVDIQNKRKEEEKAKRLTAVNILEKKHDEVRNITWYYSKKRVHNGTFCYAYIADTHDGNMYLKLKIQYHGSDWIFFKHAYLYFDGNTREVDFDEYRDKKEEVGGGVYEWIDVNVDHSLLQYLRAMITGTDVKCQLNGKYSHKFVITPRMRESIAEILLAYDVLKKGK